MKILPPETDGQLLTKKQLAQYVGVSDRWVERAVSAGNVPSPITLPGGRLVRWRRCDIDQWIENLKH